MIRNERLNTACVLLVINEIRFRFLFKTIFNVQTLHFSTFSCLLFCRLILLVQAIKKEIVGFQFSLLFWFVFCFETCVYILWYEIRKNKVKKRQCYWLYKVIEIRMVLITIGYWNKLRPKTTHNFWNVLRKRIFESYIQNYF